MPVSYAMRKLANCLPVAVVPPVVAVVPADAAVVVLLPPPPPHAAAMRAMPAENAAAVASHFHR